MDMSHLWTELGLGWKEALEKSGEGSGLVTIHRGGRGGSTDKSHPADYHSAVTRRHRGNLNGGSAKRRSQPDKAAD